MVAPDFPFSSVQLNYNYASRPHVDQNTLGPSFFVALGNFSDRELWVHDEDGQEPHTFDGDGELKGQVLDVPDHRTVFDGNKHQALPALQVTAIRLLRRKFKTQCDRLVFEEVLRIKHQKRAQLARQIAEERAGEEKQRLLSLATSRGRCIACVWANARGLRCVVVCDEGSYFCGVHERPWKTHGRMDGDFLEKKRNEMASWQQRKNEAGEMPFVRGGATILVPIPGWPET